MSSGIDIQFVRETYQRMNDDEIVSVLTERVSGLTPEAIDVVKEEIKRRNLNPNIAKGVEAQQKTYTLEEIDKYCDIIQNLPCPHTGNTSNKLNATAAVVVKSYLFFTDLRKHLVIGSPEILDQANSKALNKTLLFGWWGFPGD